MIYIKPLSQSQLRFGRLTALPALLFAALLALTGPVLAQDGPQKLATVTLSLGMHKISAEVAQSPDERAIGLMHRSSMGASQGMLFVFEQPGQQCFWMKNTLLPLAIAFIADDGTIVNIDEMKPQTLDSHCSAKPVRYVLEMNTRWFDKRGIKAGSRLSGAPFKP